MNRKSILIVIAMSAVLHAQELTAYAGTYTRGESKGIYALRFQPKTGQFIAIGLAAETSNPSFLIANRRFLYAANEDPMGTVSAFAIDSGARKLKLLNSVSTRGSGPCHVALDRTGKWLFAANYNSGSVVVFPIQADGSLGESSSFVQHSGSSVNPQRQEGPHAHEVVVALDNTQVLVPDLGLDKIRMYRFDATKGLLNSSGSEYSLTLAAGSGPRHMAFRPDGRYAYVLNELAATVTMFHYKIARFDASYGGKAHGKFQVRYLDEFQTISTLPPDFTGPKSAAEIAVHPNGKFLYASNRGHDSIAIFRIDPAKGTLTAAGHVSTQGKTPRNFVIDPTGAWLLAANQDSGTIVVFRIDLKTGALTPTGQAAQVPSPVSVAFVK